MCNSTQYTVKYTNLTYNFPSTQIDSLLYFYNTTKRQIYDYEIVNVVYISYIS